MIVIPVKQSPTRYREVVHTDVEVVSADYMVDTIVHFKERVVENYEREVCCAISNSTLNCEIPKLISYCKYKPSEQYGFRVTVHLSGDEYIENKRNINEYVCNKAKELLVYKKMLEVCLSKVSEDREYEVEIFVSNDPESIKINTIKSKHKEYIPVW